MKKQKHLIWGVLFLGIILLLFSYNSPHSLNTSLAEANEAASATNEDYVSGEVIVKYKAEAVANEKEEAEDILAHADYTQASGETLSLKVEDDAFVGQKDNEEIKLYRAKAADGSTDDNELEQVVEELNEHPAVEYAEPNYLFRTMASPDDTYYSQQWGFAKIQSESAWAVESGESTVVIAVVDTGVDWDHEDLADNIWTNSGEDAWADPDDPTSGNGTDDDGNGYIDDWKGWDFVDTDEVDCTDADCETRDNNPDDDHGHGTHVSGIAAAVTDNATGVAGVCQHCSIMAVRAGYEYDTVYGVLENIDAAAAIEYAVDMGADVINLSWGSYSSSSLIRDAIEYAVDHDVVVVASAGNDSTNSTSYPAAYDGVLAIAATTSFDARSSFSNYGSWVDLAAPGSSIKSCTPNDSYASWSGTSMATPFVAGVAGLLRSHDATLTADEISIAIINSAVDIGVSGIGAGRLDALTALQYEASPMTITTSSLASGEVGTAYSRTLAALGGIGSKTWSISSGALPSGLSLNASTGKISGTLTKVETKTFTVQVEDSQYLPEQASKQLSISVDPAELTITTNSLASGRIGTTYVATLAAAGGQSPYSWSIVSGSLPAGLTLSASTGKISGMPTTYQTKSFTVRVTDSYLPSDTDQTSLSIKINAPTLQITTTSLPSATVNTSYSKTLSASGGITPRTWKIVSGSLPTGLALSTSGKIRGTPAKIGTFDFRIRVSSPDGQTESKTYEMTAMFLHRHPDGSLIKTAKSAAVYLLEDSKKRPISSADVFFTHGFRWEQVVLISTTELNMYQTGEEIKLRDGAIVKGSSAAVYVIRDDTKRVFPSADVYLGLGYRWDMVRSVPDSELRKYSTGAAMGSEASGQVVKASGAGVYLLENGKKHSFPSANVFLGSGYAWSDIKKIADKQLASYPDGSSVQLTHLPGTLVKTSNAAAVYLLEGSGTVRRRLIPSAEVFQSRGYDWGQIVTVRSEELNRYVPSANLNFRPATVLKGSSSAIYLVDGTIKKPFPSASVFLSRGYQWESIVTAPAKQLTWLVTGSPVD